MENTKKQIVLSHQMARMPEHASIWLEKGLKMLEEEDKQDSPLFKLRVVDERHGIWIIEDGVTITLLHKSEY